MGYNYRMWKNVTGKRQPAAPRSAVWAALCLTLAFSGCATQRAVTGYLKSSVKPGAILEVSADPGAGFHWPYLLSIPEKLGDAPLPILVVPNNTGTAVDDDERHRAEAERYLRFVARFVSEHGMPFAVLSPIFPRYQTRLGGVSYYTHALDRDVMTISSPTVAAVTLEWNGAVLTEGNCLRFDLDRLFMVQDDMIHACVRSDFDATKSVVGVSSLKATFFFEAGTDLRRPFNVIELPRAGGMFFKDVRLDADGRVVNPEDANDPAFRITGASERLLSAVPRSWDVGGNPSVGDPLTAIQRLDVQLIAMVDDARRRLREDLGLELRRKMVLFGFSASGMFSDRFSFLHPELVEAAVIGSPGGLPLLPVASLNGEPLRYPMGIMDYQEIAGKPFDAALFGGIPRYVYLGQEDGNDSVVFRDGFDREDERIVFKAIGRTPQDRFRTIRGLFEAQGMKGTTFALYPGAGHQMTREMQADVAGFLSAVLAR
jgi:pimeloyl-ACP methyl ester carboxylesterase